MQMFELMQQMASLGGADTFVSTSQSVVEDSMPPGILVGIWETHC